MAVSAGEELVDWIDEAGNVLGVVPRREMRERGLLHRSVYVLVFSSTGELLVHQRTPTKDIWPSHWDVTVGGVLAAGESFDEGARREVLEEIGVSGDPESLFPYRYADARTAAIGHVYRLTSDGPFRFQPEEVVFGEFLPWDEVDRRIAQEPFCPDGLEVLQLYRVWLASTGSTAG